MYKNINEFEDSEESLTFWNDMKDFLVKNLHKDENLKFSHVKGSTSAYIVVDGIIKGHLNLDDSNVPDIPYELRADNLN